MFDRADMDESARNISRGMTIVLSGLLAVTVAGTIAGREVYKSHVQCSKIKERLHHMDKRPIHRTMYLPSRIESKTESGTEPNASNTYSNTNTSDTNRITDKAYSNTNTNTLISQGR